MATVAYWQNRLFIQQLYHSDSRMNFDDNATGLQGGGLNDSFLGLVGTYPDISVPSLLVSNPKTTGLSEYHVDDSIQSIQNPITVSFSSLMDPYSFTLYIKGLMQANTIEAGTFTAQGYTDPEPWLYYSLLKPMNNSNAIDVDRESFEYWGAIPSSVTISGKPGDVMRNNVTYLALSADRTNVIGRISNEPRLIYKAGDGGYPPSNLDVYRESSYNSYTLLDSSPTFVSDDSSFTTPNHLSAGNVEIANSTGHFNFSQADLDSYDNQNIIVYYSKAERSEYYSDKRVGFAGNVVPFKFQDLIATINSQVVDLTKIDINLTNNISANYYDRQKGYKWVLGKLDGTVTLHINWGDSVIGGAEGIYEYFKEDLHALQFYWGSVAPDSEGEAELNFDGRIKSLSINDHNGELHSNVVFEIAKEFTTFQIEVGIDENKLQSTTTSTTSTSTTSTSTTSTSTSVTETSTTSTSTTSTSTTSTSTTSTSTSTTTTSTTSTSTTSTTSTSTTTTSLSSTTSTSTTSTSTSTTSTSTSLTSTSTSSTSTTTTPSSADNTIGAAGDYTSVAAWVSGEQGDFVSESLIHRGRLIDSNLDVTSTTSITGATTSSDYHWWLTSDVDTRRHTGQEGTGASLTASSDIGAAALLQSDDDVRIDFIEIDCNSNAEIGLRIHGGSLWMLIDGNIIHGAGTSSTPTVGGIGITVEDASNLITIRNNLIYDCTDINGTGDAYGIYIATAAQTNIYIHNNSLHEIGDSGDSDCYGIYTNTFSGDGECINNAVIDVLGTVTSLCFANLGSNITSGLISSDTTAVGPNNRINETAEQIYANITTRNYHLVEGSYAENSGTDLGSYFSHDFEEDNRPYPASALPRFAGYYVDSSHASASDSNPGTYALPWLTIQHAADIATQPGDVIYVRAGTYDEKVTCNDSGSLAGGFINFVGYPGDSKPIMRGFTISSQSYIRIIGFEMTHNSTAFYRTVQIFTSNHIEILDNYFHHTYGEGGQIRWYDSNNTYITVRGNEFYMSSCPTNVSGGCTGNGWAVQMTGGSHLLIEYNEAHRCGDFVNVHGTYIVVRNNFLHDFQDAYWANGSGSLHADIFQPAGIPANPCQYQIYESNFMGDNIEANSHLLQMRTAGSDDHHIMFRGNVGYNFGSYAMQSGGVDNVYYYNNTIHNINNESTWAAMAVRYNAESGDYSLYNHNFNNIYSDIGLGTPVLVESGNVCAASNNLCYDTGGHSSCDSSGDPAYVNATGLDFHLGVSSAAIGLGKEITTVTSANGSGTSFSVVKADFFYSGYGIAEGDRIKVGSNDPVFITNIAASTITVDTSITWVNGDNVYWRNQTAVPDAGAFEYQAGGYDYNILITSHENNEEVNGVVSIQTSVTNDEVVRFVMFYVDGIPVEQVYSSPYSFSWDTSDYSEGSHIVEARAYALYADLDMTNNSQVTLNIGYGGAWDIGCDEAVVLVSSTSTSTTSTSTTSTSTTTLSTTSTSTTSTSTSTTTTSTSSSTTTSTSTSTTTTSTSTTSTSLTTTSTTSTSTSTTSTTTTPSYTIVESTIGAAGDYPTVAAWITDKAGDFVADNEQHKGILIDNTNYDITSTITFTGATTDATRNWWLTSSPSVRHTGEEGTGARIRVNDLITTMVSMVDDTIIDYVEFDGRRGTYPTSIGVLAGATNYCRIDSCIIHKLGGGAAAAGISSSGTDQNLDIWNNSVYDIIADGIGGSASGIILSSEALMTIFNNSIDEIGQTGDVDSAGISLSSFTVWGYQRNNIVTRVSGTTPSCFIGFTGWTNSNNTSSDATAPGNAAQINIDAFDIFADPTNRDYHLVSGSPAYDTGYDLSAYFVWDIDGDARPYNGVFDRGCDEAITLATSTSTSTTSTSTTSTSSSTSTTVTATSTSTTSTSTSTTTSTSTSSTTTSTTTTTTSTTTSTSTTSTSSSTTTTTTIAVVESTIGAAGDYTSINNWVAGQVGDFVGDNEIQKGILIDATLSVTVEQLMDGATTDIDHYWWLTVEAGEEHDGTAGSGNRLINNLGANDYFLRALDDAVVEYVEIDGNSVDCFAAIILQGVEYNRINNCLIYDVVSNTSTGYIVRMASPDEVYFYNNLIYNCEMTNSIISYAFFTWNYENAYVFNNTIQGVVSNDVSAASLTGLAGFVQLGGVMNLRNNIVADTSCPSGEDWDFGFNLSDGTFNASNNISSDDSTQASIPNQSSNDLFRNHTTGDFYPDIVNSVGMNTGYDLSAYFTNDIAGTARPFGSGWDIGCFEATTIVVESTIGAAGDYTTIPAWISDKAGDFITDDEVHKGILIDDAVYSLGLTTLTITGATTDVDHYWWLTSDPSVRHTGLEGTGARISIGLSTNMIAVENDFKIDYLEIYSTGSVQSLIQCSTILEYINISNNIIHDVGWSLPGRGVSITSDINLLEIWNNCIYDISCSQSGSTILAGIYIPGTMDSVYVYNNTVLDVSGTTGNFARGIDLGPFITQGENKNNIVLQVSGGGSSNCFYGTAGWQNSHLVSGDLTAVGPNALTERDDTYILFADPLNRDYRLVDGSVALNSGWDGSTYFIEDFQGDARPYGVAWDRGCDEGTPFVTGTSTSSSTTSTSTTSTSSSTTSTTITGTTTSTTTSTSTSTTTTSTSTSTTSTTSTSTSSSTTTSTSTTTTLIPDDPEWIERHESPAGFDNPSDWLGTTDEPDSNYSTSSVVGAPVDWGNECCQYVDAEVEWPSPFEPTWPTQTWWKWEFIIESESLDDYDYARLLLLSSSSLGTVGNIYLYHDGGSNRRLRVDIYHDGSSNVYYSLSTQFISLDTAYILEFKWDADNDKWGWRLDGINQPNDQDSSGPVLSDGTLTSTHQPNCVTGQTGQTGATSETITFYLDNVAADTRGWIGEAGVGTTTSTSSSTTTSTSTTTTSTTTTSTSTSTSSTSTSSTSTSTTTTSTTTTSTTTTSTSSSTTTTTPTESVSIIDTDGTQSPDYTSLADWESNEQRNLVSSSEVEIAECRATTGVADDNYLLIISWETGPGNYIEIGSYGAHRHSGYWDDTKYRLHSSAPGNNCFSIAEACVRIIGIQMKAKDGGKGISVSGSGFTQGREMYFEKNLITMDGESTSGTVGIDMPLDNGYSANYFISNNAIFNITNNTTTNSMGIFYGVTGANEIAYVYNNTIYGVFNDTPSIAYGILIQTEGDKLIAKNNIVQNTGGVCYSGSFTSSTNNLSDDGTAPGSNPQTGTPAGLIDPDNGDLRLAYTDSVAKENGIDLSGDTYPITDDIEDRSRPVDTDWDIGCSETTGSMTSTSTTTTSTSTTTTSTSTTSTTTTTI